MADGDLTAESDIGAGAQAAAPFLSAVPYVGPLLTAGAGILGGFLKSNAAAQQAKRAAALRAQQVPLQPLRPEYQRKMSLDEMTAAMTVPGYNQATQQLDASTAQNIRAIADRSPSGGATLTAIGNALYQKNQGLQKLQAANEDFRTKGLQTVSGDLSTQGDKERDLEVQQHADKALLNAGATNLETAATSNKLNGITQAILAVGKLGSLTPNDPTKNPQNLAYLKKQGYMIDANGNIVAIPKTATTSSPTNSDILPDDGGDIPDNLG